MALKLLVLIVFALPNLWASDSFEYTFLQHVSGLKIRISKLKGQPHKKAILICPGRASFIEKNEFTAQELNKLGLTVFVLDWRGHGGSDRVIQHAQKVFVNSFEDYVEDMELALGEIKSQGYTEVFVYGASMGGAVALLYLQKNPQSSIKGLILNAPMVGVVTKPYPVFLARALAWVKTKTGSDGGYCYGYGNYKPERDHFDKNTQTHDPEAFERQKQITQQHPAFITGGPTFGWLNAAFQAMDQVGDCERLKTIQTPILFAQAGDDRVVDNTNSPTIAQCLPRVTYSIYEGAYHTIMHETPEIRGRFLKDIEAFIQSNP